MRDVSDKMLIQQLKELQADGLVRRIDQKAVPPRVVPPGVQPRPGLVPLCIWGTQNMAEAARVFAERDAGNRREEREPSAV